jgi:GntR family transcriptional regulator/MocR family aminotransferase
VIISHSSFLPSAGVRIVEITPSIIDRAKSEPIYLQVVKFLRSAIASGRIPQGAVLPSSRHFAQQLGVSRATIVAAYDVLLSEDLVCTATGSGTVVRSTYGNQSASLRHAACASRSKRGANENAADAIRRHTRTLGPHSLEPRIAPADHIEPIAWRRLLAAQSRNGLPAIIGYQSRGLRRLRENIATYVMLSRGLGCDPDEVVIASSAQQALTLIAQIAREDVITFHFEPLSFDRARRAFESQQASVRILPGFFHQTPEKIVAEIRSGGVFVMPNCHYPLGVALTKPERQVLAGALDARRLWAVEDAQDLEFLDSDIGPTLCELRSGQRTFHLGVLSTVLLPFVQLAYVVAPRPMAERLADKRSVADDDIPPAVQAAATEMLETGMFHALARSARQTAARRRALFYAEAARHDVWALPCPDTRRSLHGLLWVDAIDRPQTLRAELSALDPGIKIIVHREIEAGSRIGLVMGFASIPDDLISQHVALVAQAVERAVKQRTISSDDQSA